MKLQNLPNWKFKNSCDVFINLKNLNHKYLTVYPSKFLQNSNELQYLIRICEMNIVDLVLIVIYYKELLKSLTNSCLTTYDSVTFYSLKHDRLCQSCVATFCFRYIINLIHKLLQNLNHQITIWNVSTRIMRFGAISCLWYQGLSGWNQPKWVGFDYLSTILFI